VVNPSRAPEKILIRSPNWIGEQILAFPFFHYLRQAYPRAHIAAACVPWVASIQFRALVDTVFVLPAPHSRSVLAKLLAVEDGARMLREAGPWELGFCLPNSLSSGWSMFRAGVRVRRGYVREGRGMLFNEGLPWDADGSRHRAEVYVGLLPDGARPERPVERFWGRPSDDGLTPRIAGVLERFDAARNWPDAKPMDPPRDPYWVLAPGTRAESRRWPEECFAALARRVAAETGWTGIVVGGPDDGAVAGRLSRDPDLRLQDWTGRGPVTAYWRLFAGAKFTVGNDSGLAHVASLCGSPVQIVWGAGDPSRTKPLGPGRVGVAFNPVDCWPCERNTCSEPAAGRLRCLRGISPEMVWSDIKRLSGDRLSIQR
jgi:lipopolysaccharide heptosyltransferase II